MAREMPQTGADGRVVCLKIGDLPFNQFGGVRSSLGTMTSKCTALASYALGLPSPFWKTF